MKGQAYKLTLMKEKLERTFKALKDEVGKMAVNHFQKSFDIEGFNSTPYMHWKLLKRERTRYRDRKILTQTGALKRSLKYKSRVSARSYSVEVYSDSPYAKIHNEGLMGMAWGKHPFKMPKRQFMGYSKTLARRIETRINNRINAAMK